MASSLSNWHDLPSDLRHTLYTYLDVRSHMCTLPRVCKMWNSYLTDLISKNHLDLRPIASLSLDTKSFLSCLSYIKNRQTSLSQVDSIALDIRSVRDQNSVIHALGSFESLQCIHLGRVSYLTTLEFFKQFKHLHSLQMAGASIQNDELEHLRSLPLDTLELWDLTINRIDALKELPLKNLCINQCLFISDAALNVLKAMPLVSLSLMSSEIRRFPELVKSTLRTLDISYTQHLNPACITTIARLLLTDLNLSNCSWIIDLNPLSENTSLKTLNLSMTKIRDRHLLQLPPHLTDLNISNCLYIYQITVLTHLKKLERLDLRGAHHITDSLQRAGLKTLTNNDELIVSPPRIRHQGIRPDRIIRQGLRRRLIY
jgi:hypothetical protein